MVGDEEETAHRAEGELDELRLKELAARSH